jgi:carbonic anhydrase
VKKIENVTIPNLLPTTQDYMTYEGSQTQPGCSETVTWIILNKPIYITHKQVQAQWHFEPVHEIQKLVWPKVSGLKPNTSACPNLTITGSC